MVNIYKRHKGLILLLRKKKAEKKRHKRGIAAVFFTLNTECNLGSVLVLISPQHPHLDSNQACAL